MKPGRLLLPACLLLGACAATPMDDLRPVADHHVHIRSEIAGEALPRVQRARGKARHELSPGRQDADELIEMLDRHGIRHAAVLSLGYMYAIPDIDFENEYEKVRRENDFVAEEAARYPERLVAFCGISPLADYALAEIDRCADKPVVGIKMHMANSDVDLRRDEHLEKTAAAFARANRHGLAIVIHLRGRGAYYDKRTVERFLEEILPQAPDVSVQLAHLGGGGGTDLPTLRAARRIAEVLDEHPNVFFDLSGAFFRDRDFRGQHRLGMQRRQNRAAVARLIEAIGSERILFASDWDSLEVRDSLEPLRSLLHHGLSHEDLARILQNRAPYLDH